MLRPRFVLRYISNSDLISYDLLKEPWANSDSRKFEFLHLCLLCLGQNSFRIVPGPMGRLALLKKIEFQNILLIVPQMKVFALSW